MQGREAEAEGVGAVSRPTYDYLTSFPYDKTRLSKSPFLFSFAIAVSSKSLDIKH